jgi:hypothetical protein
VGKAKFGGDASVKNGLLSHLVALKVSDKMRVVTTLLFALTLLLTDGCVTNDFKVVDALRVGMSPDEARRSFLKCALGPASGKVARNSKLLKDASKKRCAASGLSSSIHRACVTKSSSTSGLAT